MIKLQVQCSNNNDSVKQFLSHDRKNGATPLLSLNCLFHEMVREKLSEAHSLGFLVRWLEGSWPEQQHQWTSDTAPSSHQWGSPHSWQPESIITQCISRPLPKQWKKITFSSFFFFMQFLKKKIQYPVGWTPHLCSSLVWVPVQRPWTKSSAALGDGPLHQTFVIRWKNLCNNKIMQQHLCLASVGEKRRFWIKSLPSRCKGALCTVRNTKTRGLSHDKPADQT